MYTANTGLKTSIPAGNAHMVYWRDVVYVCSSKLEFHFMVSVCPCAEIVYVKFLEYFSIMYILALWLIGFYITMKALQH